MAELCPGRRSMNDQISIRASIGQDLEVAVERGTIAIGSEADGDSGLPAIAAAISSAAAPEREALVLAFLRQEAARFLELDRARLPADRSLLALGLDSLSAAELAGAVEAGLGVQLSIGSLLEGPSLAELGERVLQLLAGAAAPGAGAPPAPRAAARPAAAADAGPRPEAAPAARIPLSWGQRAIWLLDRLAPGNPAYVIAGAGRIAGELAVPELRRALAALVARHPALRTTFELDGEETVQVVHQDGSLAFSEEDAAAWSAAQVEERLIAEAHRPFDLAKGPLLRVAILHRGAEHFVVLAVHHIVADFGSVGVLLRDLGAIYGGQSLPPPSGSYADFVRLEAARLAGARGDRLRAYWSAALPPGRPVLELPTDRPRPPLQTFRGGAQTLRLDDALTASLHAAGRGAGATPFMTLLAVFQVLLHRHSGQEEILVGTPTAGRGANELANLVGYLVNPVVVRGDLAGDPSFLELLGRVRETAIAAFSHQDYPFPLLAELLGGERDASRSPVFQAMFTLYRERRQGERGLGGFALGESGSRLRLGGLEIESVRLPRRAAQLDLTLLMAEIDGGLAAALQFNSDLFDAATAARMLGQLRNVAAAIAGGSPGPPSASGALAQRRAISALPLLAAAERHQVLLEWNDTAAAWRPEAPLAPAPPRAAAAVLLHELFERQAARRPQSLAVSGQGVKLTYGELERRANQLARYLRRLGVRAEVRVGLCVERTPQMVVALLAILKAGGAYVPLDPSHPAERLALVLGDGAVQVLITEERWLGRLGGAAGPYVVCLDREGEWIAAEEGSQLPDAAAAGRAEGLAYLIYTSGSTGRPKGVGVPHRAVVNFLRSMARRPGLGVSDVMTALTTLSFDIAALEIHLPLAVGARVEVVGSEESADGRRLAARLAASGATAMQATPATWRLLLDAGWTGAATAAQDAAAGRPAFKALCGGEALPWELASALLARGVELWNLYGPTETAVWSATRRVTARPVSTPGEADGGGVVGLGQPIANTRFRVVDPRFALAPIGAGGELLIGGAGVARGYLGRPELTAERFVPDPWSAHAGARLYRTGDLVRHRAGGDLEFLGRIDHQVKVRGFRIELGEIESALLRHAGVSQAVVTVRGEGTDRRLVAYLVPRPAGNAGEASRAETAAVLGFAELRDALRRSLPDYMVPADFVVLDRLPLGPSGKVDRKALPAPPGSAPGDRGEPTGAADPAGRSGAVPGAAGSARRTGPRTPTEELVAGLWAEVLGIAPADAGAAGAGEAGIAADDDFFRLGGHSLLAVRVAARLRDVLGVELPLARLLQLSRLEDLAREVEGLGRAGRPLPAPIARLPRPPLAVSSPASWAAALSFAQERLWFLDQLEPGSPTYNEPRALRLAGPLVVAALAASLGEIRRRHEVLRTRFVAEPGAGLVKAVAAAAPAAAELALPVVDLSALPAEPAAAVAERLVTADARRPFDLAAGPLMRTALLRLAARHNVLLLNLHHIVSDGGSLEVLARELAALYAAGASGMPLPPGALPALPIQYADFARWQRDWLSGETLTAEIDWWRQQLAGSRGEPPPLELPLDRPRPAVASRRGGRRAMTLPGSLAGELAAVARRHGVTVFMTLLAAFDTLLCRYSGQTDVTIGTPVANRDRPETANLIGLFVNTLVLRLDLAGDPGFGELLRRTRQAALAAYAHQDVPFGQLVGELAPHRDLAETPFFQVVLALQPAPPALSLPALEVEYLDPDSGTAKFDLSLALHPTAAGALTGNWTYRTDLFEATTLERLGGQWRNLLAGVVAAADRRLSELPLLAAAERHQLLVEWTCTSWPRQDSRDLLHTPFERQAALDPAAVALVAAGGHPGSPADLGGPGASGVATLTYGALERRANRLARALRALQLGAEPVVAICTEPSFDLLAGLLAILKAGGAYLPLDPAHPPDRLARLVADAGARVALADRHAAAKLPAAVRIVLLDDRQPEIPESLESAPVAAAAAAVDGAGGVDAAAVDPDHAAYVIYTSGSTGAPKGVVVSHRAVANRLRFQLQADLRPGARVLQRTRLGFDVSVLELFAPLWAGATVVLTPPAVQQDASRLAQIMVDHQVTNLTAPPTLIPALLAEESFRGCRSLRLLVTGADRVPGDLPQRFFAAFTAGAGGRGEAPPLFSRYGPTEATISVSEFACRPDPASPEAAPDTAAPAPPVVPLGRSIAGARLHVLDRGYLAGLAAGPGLLASELPTGAPGELCIGGICLARCYLGRPDLTAAAFIPDPFARHPEEAGGRLYRTGDLVRYRADGNLEFLGRIDHQVKIRGFRVELGEVEAALESHPAVARGVAVADGARGGRLVAYLVARQELDVVSLRAHLAQRLPDYMMPTVWVEIAAVPLTPSGKVDRRSLPDPDAAGSDARLAARIRQSARPADRGAVRTQAEELLAGIWSELLGVDEIAADDDFFGLGGHSLLATQLVSRVRPLFGVELPLRRIFECPTLAGLAAEIVSLSAGQPAAAGPSPILPAITPEHAMSPIAAPAGTAAAAAAAAPPIPRAPRAGGGLRLSFAQERLWFLDQLEPGSPAYNLPSAYRADGPLDVAALAFSLGELVRRHEILRTVFAKTADGPLQVIRAHGELRLPLVDLRGLGAARRAAEVPRRLAEEARRPFDLARGPVLRATLLVLARDEHVVLLTLHQIAGDAASAAVVMDELAALYEGRRARRPPRLPELPIQYADYAAWQRRQLSGAVLDAETAFWRGRLAGAPPLLLLPTDRPLPPRQSFRGSSLQWSLDEPLSQRLRALGRRQGATPFMILLGGLAAVLSRHTGQSDFCVGTPTAGRDRPETLGLIGCFTNLLVLRCDLAGDPGFAALLGRMRQRALEAQAHDQLPFELLIEALQPKRSLSREPLVQVIVDDRHDGRHDPPRDGRHDDQRPRRQPLAMAELAWRSMPLRQELIRCDLLFAGFGAGGPGGSGSGMGGRLGYRTDLFDGPTVARLLGHLETLLAAAAAAPETALSELPLLTRAERQQLHEWNDTAVERDPDLCLHELIARQVARRPQAVAVIHEDEALSYGELDRRARELAGRLAEMGVGPEVRVGLAVERSLEMMVGLLAILGAGGAYVPLDPAYPAERMAFMIDDSQGGCRGTAGGPSPVLLSQRRLAAKLHEVSAQLPSAGAHVVYLDEPAPAAPSSRPERGERAAGGRRAAGSPRTLPENLLYVIYTSGSTGRPKGAMNSHRAVVNRLLWMQEAYRLTPADRVLQKTPISFDVSVWELFWPLLAGAALVVARPGGHQDRAYLVRSIAEQAITTLHFVPSMLQVFLEAPGVESLPSLARVFASGEALPAELERRFQARLARPALHNLYGPTEAAVDVTAWRCERGSRRSAVPIGRPVANTAIHLFDRALRPVGAGVAAELYIGGVQPARGYLDRPDLTAERFLPDPAAAAAGARMYRTGDLARRLADGSVDFLGRVDHQVKIRGFRIELGEIEAALAVLPGVRDAAVMVRETGAGDRRLVAYVAGGPEGTPEASAMREALLRTLPEHMVPAAFCRLDALPLTVNGKVDRAALSGIEEVLEPAAAHVAPRGPVERGLTGVWEEVLGRQGIGVHEDFFVLGGHSLLAMQVVSRVHAAFGVELPVRRLFEARTVDALARVVEEARAAARGAPPAPTLAARDSTPPPGARAPLSFAQQRLWFLDQLEPNSAAYNMPGGLELHGDLGAPEVGLLRRTFAEVVRRHEALRTSFAATVHGPVQVIADRAEVALPVVSLAGTPGEGVPLREAWRLAREEARRPFTLSAPPLLRVVLLRLSPRHHMLLATMHHIISDGWSIGVLLREIAVIYGAFQRGHASPLPELPIQYREFARWQRDWLQGEVLDAQLAYWRNQLAGAPRRLDLPADRPRPAVSSRRGGAVRMQLSAALSQQLAALSRREAVTPFMTLAAGFVILLGRSANQHDVLVGTPIANRNRREIEGLIGFFVNTLVLRVDLGGAPTVRQLLRRVHDVALGAYAHQDLPFERLVEEAAADRDLGAAPLFRAMFVLQNAPLESLELPGLACRILIVPNSTPKFDLTLTLSLRDGQLGGALEYDRDLFDAATARRQVAQLENLFAAIARQPASLVAELPLLSPAERHQLLREWGDAGQRLPAGAGLAALFAARVRSAPHAPAVTCEGAQLTYAELDRRANRLGHRLRELGVGPEERVGLCLERSLDLVVSVLAIVKAGGAYVPLDPSYPRERRDFMLEDSGARVVVGTAATLAELPGGAVAVRLDAEADDLARRPAGDLPPPPADGSSAAYVIYTSGSTGKPKGVVVSHANVVRLFQATWPWFRFDAADVWTLFHSYAFDFSVWELWGALVHGGRLVVVPYLVSRTPEAFRQLLAAERVTVLNQTPSAFAQLMHADEAAAPGAALADLRLVIFGGEALEPFRLAPWFRRHGDERPRLVNMYGITETTVHVTYRPLRGADARAGRGSVIGGPIPDLAAYVLDAAFQPAPIGVAGELCIGGAGLARGYLGRPELTAARFVPDPCCGPRGEPGARLYRSGDLGRLLPAGELEYLGRIDHQVKIRGFRIELEEIQVALQAHPQVREAIVLAKEDEGGDRRLVAYVVPKAGPAPAAAELRDLLAGQLPDYMVPAAFVLLENLPLTENLKVDRKALLGLSIARREEAHDYQPPSNDTEAALAEIWEQVLGLDRVGIDDRFFSLGGDSILSLRVRARAAERGLHFTLPQLFEHQTVRQLAAHLETSEAELAAATAPFALLAPGDREALPAGLEDAYPLTVLQTGMLFHSEFSAESTLYHNVSSVKLTGAFDAEALRGALDLLVERHPIVRTAFDLSRFGEPLQLVYARASAPLVVEDLRGVAAAEQERLLKAALAAERRQKFDISIAPLLRFRVHQLGDEVLQLTWTEHHAIMDGWSVASMIAELFQLYRHLRGRSSAALPPPPAATFRDFVALERRVVAALEGRQFFLRQLAGAPRLRLPGRPAEPGAAAGSPRVRDFSASLGPDRTVGLKRLAGSLGVPIKSILLAAYFRVLGAITGQTDLVSGLVVNGRPEVRDGERILGLFVNTVPLRLRLAPGSWSDLIRQVSAAEQEIVPHRRYPMALVQQAAGRGALFDTSFNFTHFHVLRGVEDGEMRLLGDYYVADVELPLSASIALDTESQRIGLHLQFDERQLDRWQVEKVAAAFLIVFDAMLASPEGRHDEHLLLSAAERQQQLREWNDTAAPRQDRLLHQLFDLQAQARPDAVAVVARDEVVTYGELRHRARRLAHRLRSLGAGPEVRVGLLLERSPDLVAGLLAILEAGAAYVPMDPEYPPGRLAYILQDSGSRILLTRSGLAGSVGAPDVPGLVVVHLDGEDRGPGGEDRVPGGEDRGPGGEEDRGIAAGAVAGADNLAYVIYTSGSTGQPKGVLVSHASAVNYVVDSARFYGLTGADRGLLFSSINFDASVEEVFCPLFVGAALVLRDEAMMGSPRHFLAAAGEQQISRLSLPTAYWHELAAALDDPEVELPQSLRLVDIGGEKARPEHLARWLARDFGGVTLINTYGPTEATVACSRTRLERLAGREVSIGRPVANAGVYLLGPDLLPLPAGAVGMLFIGGAGVARGYLGRPELTAESFVPDPWSAAAGARMYRTGDLAAYQPDGTLEFRGRGDEQVKIRGFRVEPGEIEIVLSRHPAVLQAVVMVREDAHGESFLAAYVVAGGEPRPAAAELKRFLREQLPAHMVPAAFVFLDRLPLNANGKIDRPALPAPERRPDELARGYLAPRDALELQLAGMWEELLGSHPIGVRDDFFELGGHSLLAVQLMARIQASFGRSLATATLLRHPTVERLAAVLRDVARPARRAALVAMTPQAQPAEVGPPRPFFCVHPIGGEVLCYVHLARHLAAERPLFGIQVPDRDGGAPWTALEEMAAYYVRCLREVQPAGPYRLGGWSLGGVVAFEMARQLEGAGESVELLALIDAAAPAPGGRREGIQGGALVALFVWDLARLFGIDLPTLSTPVDVGQLTAEEALACLRVEAERSGVLPLGLEHSELVRRFATFEANYRLAESYSGGVCAAPLTLLKAGNAVPGAAVRPAPDLGWGRLARGPIEVLEVPGDHYTLLHEPGVQVLAALLRERFAASG